MPDAEGLARLEADGVFDRVKRARQERDRAHEAMLEAQTAFDSTARELHDAERDLRERIEELLA